jgi:hypothetical protein
MQATLRCRQQRDYGRLQISYNSSKDRQDVADYV